MNVFASFERGVARIHRAILAVGAGVVQCRATLQIAFNISALALRAGEIAFVDRAVVFVVAASVGQAA